MTRTRHDHHGQHHLLRHNHHHHHHPHRQQPHQHGHYQHHHRNHHNFFIITIKSQLNGQGCNLMELASGSDLHFQEAVDVVMADAQAGRGRNG
jgi:hypothetical protein